MMLDKVRTQFSFGQVYGQLDKVIAACTGTHVLIADTNTWGHIPFHAACKKADKVPLLGVVIGIVDDVFSNKDRAPSMWATFVAVNDEGLKELYGIVHMSHTFFYYQPRIGIDDLLSVNPKNIRVILQNSAMLARAKGHKNIWVGVSPSDYRWSVPAANNAQLPQIAVSDNYYPRPEHRGAYEILCRNPDSKTSPMHILNYEELAAALPHVGADSFEPAWKSFTKGIDVSLPKAENIHIISKKTLRQFCVEGAKRKNINLKDKVYAARLDRELKMIAQKKFEDYFYLVNDLCVAAKKQMLVGPARGSSAGSLVCYLMDITEVDPIPHDLLFERFIDITRADLPDIDIDFPDKDWVFKYLQGKYGVDNVARIGTILTYQAKSAITDVSKALRIPEWEVKPVKDAVIERSGGDARAAFCLKDTFESLDVGKALLVKYPALAIASELEEHAKSSGIHAAGVIVCNAPVHNYCGVTAEGVACIDKYDAEKINMLKIDALGLRTLIILQDALEQIGKPNEFLYTLPLEDKAAFDLLTVGRYAGIFQFEGYALKSLTAQMGVRIFEDIVSITSLARPGPLHNGAANEFVQRRIGKEEVTYMHSSLEPFLKDTLGTMVYQEQIMAIVKNIGNFSWEDTTSIRKAMSKTLGEEYFNQYIEKFVAGADTHGIDRETAVDIWNHMSTHGSWCLSGNTTLRNPFKNQFNTAETFTIKELYDAGGIAPNIKHNNRRQKLYCLQDMVIKPASNVEVMYSGEHETWLVEVDSGENIRATMEHKFLCSDMKYRPLKELVCGSAVLMFGETAPTARKKKSGTGSGGHNWWGVHKDGKPLLKRQIAALRRTYKLCQRCKVKPYQETHHVNGDHTNHSPENLLPVCRSCHRRLHGVSIPHSKGKSPRVAHIISISAPLVEETYDIAMPTPHNNFVANDFIVHNSFNKSHGVSYGLISYWCAYLKAHHPLEFAAATLRNLKDADQAIKVLRELVKEGYEYIPFDPALSDINWSVQEGKLVGGWLGVKGVGERKAVGLMNKIKNGFELTAAEKRMVENPEVAWADLFPAERMFGEMYQDYLAAGLSMPVSYIVDVNADGEYIIIGEIKALNQRDANEYGSVAKRGGRIVKNNSLWLNMFVDDDTGSIIVTIPRATYAEMGKPLVEAGSIGHWYMFRGKLSGGWRKLTVTKLKRLA